VSPGDRSLSLVLDRLYREFNCANSAADPVQLVRRYSDKADREVAAFCAASLAFGRVSGILRSLERLFEAMGPSPAAFVRRFDHARDRTQLESIVHRWTRGRDLVALMSVLCTMLNRSGTIEQFFLEGHDPAAPDIGPALDSFSQRARAVDLRPAYGHVPRRPGVFAFFPQPCAGSACKRLNLFLRWMVRHDAIDPGGWTGVSPSQLIVPLDTHVIRVGRCLGLTRRRTPGWRMAAEITASLRAFDPGDPVRFDFSLCHVGMRRLCGFGASGSDEACPLKGHCRPSPPNARAQRSARRSPGSGRPSARR